MKRKSLWLRAVALFIATLLFLPLETMAQEGGGAPPPKLSKGELAQLLAPIALYPDELIAQILMASTYPLEVVQADRWAQENKGLKGDALTKELEKQNWDPSVKSLVNFPSVLSVMSQKLDLTTKIGDAFLSQQQDVMETIQELRRKAYDAGNLKTTKEQTVVVEKETIVVQPASPQVVYVPTYSPTVVYGTWPYPSYPPAYYYPPAPYAPYAPLFTFAAGVAVGAAWGYAWGNCNWDGGHHGGGGVYVNHNQNTNINRSINREKYKADFDRQGSREQRQGSREWRHDPSHRKGVAYRDNATAKKFGQSPGQSRQGRREARGYGDGRGGGQGGRPSAGTMDRGAKGGSNRGAGSRPSAGTMERGGGGGAGRGSTQRASAGTMDRGGAAAKGGRDSAFSGGSGSGRQERAASQRGQSSRQSSGAGRSGGGFGGGGGGRGGFSGGGGGRGGGRGGGGRR